MCGCYLRLWILQRPVEAVVLEEAGGELGVAEDGAGDVAARAVAVVAGGGGCGGGVVGLAQGKEARVLRVEAGIARPEKGLFVTLLLANFKILL